MNSGASFDVDTLNRLFDAESVASVLDAMCHCCFAKGGDKFSYHPEIMFRGVSTAGADVYSVGYPEEWVKLYLKNGRMQVDPGPDIIMRTGKPMTWHDALSSRKLTKAEIEYVKETRDFGLTSGYGFPLWGPNGNNAFVAVGFPLNQPLPDSATVLALHIMLMTGHQRICELTKAPAEILTLSDREREVLTWVGRGKSNTDVATILAISTDTVATYMRRIYTKLSCHDRIGAVIKALRLGLIRI
ncbi:helix-turn-helix transcriptional regulator [Erythrobacter donghaensis]|uniref:helix-turn-helix transcriptional regulator n=1 Tax=Erythrobacter donghaensis TaxID=267135 RepID=UPI000A3D0810|nr:LuxR family transcriptional regulator [Erythrobacter donghaensis]